MTQRSRQRVQARWDVLMCVCQAHFTNGANVYALSTTNIVLEPEENGLKEYRKVVSFIDVGDE